MHDHLRQELAQVRDLLGQVRRRSDPGLAPVLDRLEADQVVIHDVVKGVDRALVDLIRNPGDFTDVQQAVDVLTDTLLSHLRRVIPARRRAVA